MQPPPSLTGTPSTPTKLPRAYPSSELPHAVGSNVDKGASNVRPASPTCVTFTTPLTLPSVGHPLTQSGSGCAQATCPFGNAADAIFRLNNHRHGPTEALDILLEDVTIFTPRTTRPAHPSLPSGFEVNRGRPERVNAFPEVLRAIVWDQAIDLLKRQGSSLPDSTDLGGISLGDARRCYAGLIAQLYISELSTIHLETEDTLIWGIRPRNLNLMLRTRVTADAATAFIALMTHAAGRSPVSAPLLPYEHLLLIPTDLVSPIGYERTLLRAASADPSRSGPLGNLLGLRARRWVQRLEGVPGCLVAEQVKVREPGRRSSGDLDVVAWDPGDNLAVVFETKWPVDAATLTESHKVDAHFESGRRQLMKHRAALAAGDATFLWPKGWTIDDRTEIRWFVGSAQQLDSRAAAGAADIGSTSLRLVEHLLPQPSLRALVAALDDPPYPREGAGFEWVPVTMNVKKYVIHSEALGIAEELRKVPLRRRSDGWT